MVNHADFARRLKKACTDNPVVPEKGKGQQVWLASKMGVTQEAARKYLEGLARPKPDKMTKLARILSVDEAWLALGINPSMDARGKRQYQSRAEAATYLVFGVFMANGYSCAFGSDTEEKVDFFAIKGGQQKAISVSTGFEKSKNVWHIPVKTTFEQTVNIAVLPMRPTQFEFLYLDHAGVHEHGDYKGANVTVVAHKDGKNYTTGAKTWKRLEDADVL